MFSSNMGHAQELRDIMPDSVTVPLVEIKDTSFLSLLDSLQEKKKACVFSKLNVGTYGLISFLDTEKAKQQIRMCVYQISGFFMESSFSKYEISGAFFHDGDLIIVRNPRTSSWHEEKFTQLFQETDSFINLNFKNIYQYPRYKDKTKQTVAKENMSVYDYILIIYEDKDGVLVKIREESCNTDMENYETF